MARKKKQSRFAIIDFETDPFLHGRVPKPFCVGIKYGPNVDDYRDFWGHDCVRQLCDYILDTFPEPMQIYAHNGGKFDFIFFAQLGLLSNPSLILHGRIVKSRFLGIHEIRDSFAILPVPLKAYNKDDIDYKFFEENLREEYKEPILKYLKSDCVYLYDLVSAFKERFGQKLTIGSTAISEIKKTTDIWRGDINHDMEFRPFYYGGRVDFFKHGKIEGDYKVYDVNSMYPTAMRNYKHPYGKFYLHVKDDAAHRLFDFKTGEVKGHSSEVYFIRFTGWQKGALPVKTDAGLSFHIPEGTFTVTSHELKIAIKYNLVRIDVIHDIYLPAEVFDFREYVDKFYAEKRTGKITGDKIMELFAKLMLNSGYGKFATNADEFKEYFILNTDDENMLGDFQNWIEEKAESGYAPIIETDYGNIEIWQCKSPDPDGYFDVAVAASITGASRAILLEALINADDPLYCDTDSIICKSLSGVPIGSTELGEWKLEEEIDTVYIAGKKLYSCFKNGANVKKACKGAKLTGDEIARVAMGEEIMWHNDAPAFNLVGGANFVSRRINKRC